ncbi:MAG: metallophosphoesterase family protein [archaeon]
MSLKIIHSGDIHIGLKFNNYPDYIQDKLIKARFDVIDTLVNKANERKANLLVIAGDLFDKHNISEKSVLKVINKFDRFSGDAILILPGNHDFDNGGVELWQKFRNNLSDKIILLNEKKVYDLKKFDLNVKVYAAPCDGKHSSTNNLSWIKNRNFIEQKMIGNENKYKIIVAHGALDGISPDMTDEYFKMSRDELKKLEMDLYLLGHTHLPYPFEKRVINRKIFNCGTPEPDGMNYSKKGNCWFIEIDKNNNIEAEQIKTGKFRFYDLDYEISNKEEFNKLKKQLLKNKAKNKLVRIKLNGSIDEKLYRNKENIYKDLKKKLAYFKVEDSDLKIKISTEVIKKEFSENSFPARVLEELKDDDKALQLAYEYIKEVRS